ncbi:MAG: hypothetical protein GY937_19355, partial [bacterium]|nr:hypothetical protein [bacterium]
ADTVDALAAFLKLPAAWGLMQAADSDFQKDQRTELFRDQLGDALGLLSGGPVEGIKTTAEMWSGQDLFIGGDLSDVDRNWVDSVTRLTDVVIPALGKLDRELEYSGTYESLGVLQDPERPDRNQGRLRLLNTLLGMTVTKDLNDPDQITRNMNGLSYELGSSLDELKGDLELAGTPALRIEDFLEMGDSYRQNQAFEFLLYNTIAGEPLTTEQKAELQRFVPKAILEMAGVNQSDSERSEWSVQDKENKIRSITTALQ